MLRQFTSTCYITDGEKFLLLFHPKHKKWLPPGGHLEVNETPEEAAIREVREETGLEIEFICEENIWIDRPNAVSIIRPYCCLLESIPAYGDQPAHQHIDCIFVARPIGGALIDGTWFSLEEIDAFRSDEEIFGDSKEIIYQLHTFTAALSQNS